MSNESLIGTFSCHDDRAGKTLRGAVGDGEQPGKELGERRQALRGDTQINAQTEIYTDIHTDRYTQIYTQT